MTTILTPEGWSGATSGRWSRRANRVVDERRGVSTEGRDLINARGGDDVIIGRTGNGDPGYFSQGGRLQMGGGNDLLIGSSADGVGIVNRGFIFMGSGDDRIEASGGKLGIRNRRFIFMQDGDDVMDVSEGGIRGGGFVDMGEGNNTFIGFGDHRIIASSDGEDTLLLPSGRYDVSRRGGGRNGREVRIEQGDDRLRVFEFDVVGAINSRRDERIDLNFNGTLVVRNNGTVEII
ncbi:hypothetical protein [Cyanobium sp. CH-040]|uniref:hypothetical protein n=1 Tax=Cyanobium sp. CH-040 TaxID=2823708 RepID=UPI0020CEC6A3|nr:hypothetical protein [Cyanobium sp. CH-040]MCP9926313.1 hypothetical protein [Cyanobium sp. CH-040]